ncbi:MAG: BadF/BadG/BcrA/BcrD ATPase family protein [Propionicimonas sp.]|uniref:N-acetylglucosamine kinase n=1 Tax=Propionicimonas sp. TaxID=1955623 RepID=UPI003D0A18D0
MDLEPVVVAVDGGGTKTDAVALTLDGTLLAHRRGPSSSPQQLGLERSVAVVDALVTAVASGRPVRRTELYLSGIDLPREHAAYTAAIAGLPWAANSLVDNDLFALLRAGTDAPNALAVVCGTGSNAVGVRSDGASARFAALGHISGDWGGGSGLGAEALWHAARDEDGRGPRTALTAVVREGTGVASIAELIERLHFGEFESDRLSTLAPAVFAAADAGDAVARSIVERQADEVVAYVRACVERLDLADAAIPVVLGGGVLQAGNALLDTRIAAGIADVAPHARLVTLAHRPIVGAALLALSSAGATPDALARARTAVAEATEEKADGRPTRAPRSFLTGLLRDR